MGFFSPKKIIYVSSTVYNMAGDTIRPNFLISSVFSSAMNNYNSFIGKNSIDNLISGPGIKQRHLFDWAVRTNFKGLPDAYIVKNSSIDPSLVKPYIPIPSTPPNSDIEVYNVSVVDGDYSYFADKYVIENNPSMIDDNYASDYDSDNNTITIKYSNGSSDIISATNYNYKNSYVVAYYQQFIPTLIDPIIYGTSYTTSNVASIPSTSGFTSGGVVSTGTVTYAMTTDVTTTKSYSDGRPDEITTVTENTSEDFNTSEEKWTKSVYIGGNGSTVDTTIRKTIITIRDIKQVYTDNTTTVTTETISGGVTLTTTVNRDGDHIRPAWIYQTDTQDTINNKFIGPEQIWIYEIGGSIPALNNLNTFNNYGSGNPEFFPYLPVRLNNKSITDAQFSSIYDQTKIGYRRATGGQKFTDIINKVEDNPNINDIDFSYIQYGVSLNEKEKECKYYLFEFFSTLINLQSSDQNTINNLKTNIINYNQEKSDYNTWILAQNNESSSLFNTPKPPKPVLNDPGYDIIKLTTSDPSLNYFDNRLSWIYVDKNSYTGLIKPDAKVGDIWLDKNEILSWDNNTIDSFFIKRQVTTTSYEEIIVWGLIHENFIYGGKSVKITAYQALDDINESGLIIPLHMPTIKNMGLVSATQMSLGNTYIIFNSYEIVKQRWYESFFGQLIIVIAITIISVLISPAAAGSAIGVLGTNASVGAILGLTGTSGIIAGAITNALVAIILTRALSSIAVDLFGEKWGALISAIVTFAMSLSTSGILSSGLIITPNTILSLTSSLANGYSGFISAEINEINDLMLNKNKQHTEELHHINEMIKEFDINNSLIFNPLQFIYDTNHKISSYVPETLDNFIHRTTMTGSDIVEVTLNMVYDYAKLSMILPKQ